MESVARLLTDGSQSTLEFQQVGEEGNHFAVSDTLEMEPELIDRHAGTVHWLEPALNPNLRLVLEVQNLRKLSANWDGYDGVPPTEGTIAKAITLVSNLPFDLEPPRIGISGDGEISLFWERPNLYIDFGIRDDLGCSFYARKGDIEDFGDDLDVEVLPLRLRNLIAADDV
jgi:hypothetical protein